MGENGTPFVVSPQDLLLTIGQLTVENSLLRGKVQDLEEQLAKATVEPEAVDAT